MRKTSNKGMALIKKHEGFMANAYKCPAGVWTIGYGNTFFENGEKVRPGDIISIDEADRLFLKVIFKFEHGIYSLVTSNINQNQFDALVSISYNIGLMAFKYSTLLKVVNKNPMDEEIAYQFSRWNKAGGRVLNGLVKRRKDEADLYFS